MRRKRNVCKKITARNREKLIDYENEPAFLEIQGLHYGNRYDLASFYTRQLMNDRFSEEGYPGNEDSGAMSSWFMFSAMGFFPNAGQDI